MPEQRDIDRTNKQRAQLIKDWYKKIGPYSDISKRYLLNSIGILLAYINEIEETRRTAVREDEAVKGLQELIDNWNNAHCWKRLEEVRRTAVREDEAVKELVAVLAILKRWHGTGDYLTDFEDIGRWFFKETGKLRPGKDSVDELYESRLKKWEEWTNEKKRLIRDSIGKALSRFEEKHKLNDA